MADKWNPTRYLAFANHRLRPAVELLDRTVGMLLTTPSSSSSSSSSTSAASSSSRPLRVLDLGCGTCNIHPLMRQRLIGQRMSDVIANTHDGHDGHATTISDLHITAVDASAAMLATAQEQHPHTDTSYVHGDVKDTSIYMHDQPFDVVFSNATLHWLTQTENRTLLPQLMAPRLLRPGGVLAMQVPYTLDQPSHSLMRVAAEECGFGERVRDVRVPQLTADMSPDWYYHALTMGGGAAGADGASGGIGDGDIDMWYTKYVQMLEQQPTSSSGGDDSADARLASPVADFTRSTGLQPMMAAVGGDDSADGRQFWQTYRRLVADAYRPTHDGRVLFPFTRFFCVARSDSGGGVTSVRESV